MLTYRCDGCGQTHEKPTLTIQRADGLSGGIIPIPSGEERHLCRTCALILLAALQDQAPPHSALAVEVGRVTAVRVLDTMAAIVAEHGADHRCERPSRTSWPKLAHHDRPGDIAGHVLYRLGVPIQRLWKAEEALAVNQSIAEALAHLGVTADPAAAAALDAARRHESMQTWGQAFNLARQAVTAAATAA